MKALLALVLYTGYLLQLYSLTTSLRPLVLRVVQRKSAESKRMTTLIVDYGLRSGIVFVSFLLAVAVPNLENLIPLIGITSVFLKEFPNEQTFKVWLLEECKKTCTGLWQRSKDDTKSGRKIRLRCNRAGQNRNTAKVRIRTSRKENPYCSCFLNVEYRKDGKVTAKGCFGHVGHELDPALLHLTADQQEYLKTLLEDYPVSHIIRRVREENRERKSRLSFVSRSDLFNLKKRHKITPRYRSIDRSSMKMSPTSMADDIYEDHREQGQRKLNEIMNICATLETEAKYLADSGSLDSLKKLDSILEHLKLATANIPSTNSVLYRPESVKNGVEAHVQYVESSPKQRQVNPKTRTVRNLLQRNRLMTDSSPARVPGPSWN
nr:Protein R02D3.7 [Haemonchus contortus]